MRRSKVHHGRLTLPPPPSSASISAQEVVAPLTALSMEITPIRLEWLHTAPALPLSSGFKVGKLKITAPGVNPPAPRTKVRFLRSDYFKFYRREKKRVEFVFVCTKVSHDNSLFFVYYLLSR